MKSKTLSEFAPEVLSSESGDFSLPLLKPEENIAVRKIRISESQMGKYAVLTLEDGSQIRTSSNVLVDQFKQLADKFDGKTIVWMKATTAISKQGRRYYTLADPDQPTEK